MKKHISPLILSLIALIPLSLTAPAQQRIEFQRQKFDRSRFKRPDPSMRPESPQPTPVSPAYESARPRGMVTEPPAANEPEFKFPDSTTTPPTTNPTSSPSPSSWGFSTTSESGDYTPAGATPEEQAAINEPRFELIPGKWQTDPRDFEKLLDLQKESGACMLVYFNNQIDSSQKGLCNWFEKKVTTDMSWRKAMKFYIQFQVILPGKKDAQALVEKFRVNKTPALFVVKPFSTFYTRIQVFEFPVGDRPIPIEADVVLESIKAASTPAYKDKF